MSEVILTTLGLSMGKVPRFRDVHVSDGKIAVYTRMGGGNRGHWEFSSEGKEPGPDCDCPGCSAQHVLGRHPNYLYDEDDDFDCTYATYYFSFPTEYAEGLKAVESEAPWNPDKRWLEMLGALKASSEKATT